MTVLEKIMLTGNLILIPLGFIIMCVPKRTKLTDLLLNGVAVSYVLFIIVMQICLVWGVGI